MTERQVGYLCKAATALATLPNDNSYIQLLRSYYLMRCKEITRGYGLPQQQFSVKNRCSHCCLEWTKNTDIKVQPMKLSKQQRKRIKKKKSYIDLKHSNKLVHVCSFCKHVNVMPLSKPKMEPTEGSKVEAKITIKQTNMIGKKSEETRAQKTVEKLNVYTISRDIFSLSNKKNTLLNTIKEKPKVIKNNKKKKDKFAGLCKQAVLASAKLKVEKEKSNTLSLFLKQCS